MKGKSILGISMPVTIFEDKSFLQRMARSFVTAPQFLSKAAQQNDNIVEQIKYCAAFALSSFVLQCNQSKPFNPILGETLQARINGHPIYFEQISHHPPISQYLHYGPGYTLTGSHSPDVSFQANSLIGGQLCHPTITFTENKRKIYIIWANFHLQGMVFGKRIFNSVGKTYVFEPESRLCLEIVHNPGDKGTLGNIFSSSKNQPDAIKGVIYKVKQPYMDKLIQGHKPFSKIRDQLKIDPKTDVESYLSDMTGIWHNHINFDEENYWSLDKDIPFHLDYEKNQLPSDSSFRKDLIWLSQNNINKSQDCKEEGENIQRQDEKLRKKYKQNQQKNNNKLK